MRTKQSILFLTAIIGLLAVVMLFNQQHIHAEQTAVTVTSGWSEAIVLTDETKNSVTPVLRQDSTGNMIVVYSSQTGGSVGDYTPFNRIGSGSGSPWTAQDAIYNAGGDSISPDVVYDNSVVPVAHAIWINNQEQVFYAPEGNWPSLADEVPVPAASGLSETSLAIDSSNNLHAVWQQGTIIYYAVYASNSWSVPVSISEEAGLVFSILPAIAIDDNDTVHVVWTSYINGSGGFDQKIIYKNTPVGNAFPATIQTLSGTILSAFSPFLLADGNRVHLSFTEYTTVSETQQAYYVELTDDSGWGGTTPLAVGDDLYTNIDDFAPNGSVSSMAVCGDSLHLFYFGNTLPSTTERIWGVSRENGSWDTASSAVTISDNVKRAINPYAVCNGGSIHLVFEGIPTVGEDDPHTINYIFSSNSIYLPVILK